MCESKNLQHDSMSKYVYVHGMGIKESIIIKKILRIY